MCNESTHSEGCKQFESDEECVLQFSLETKRGLPITKVHLEKTISGSENNRLMRSKSNRFIFFVCSSMGTQIFLSLNVSEEKE